MKLLFTLLIALAVGLVSADGQTTQDGIRFNVTYDCPRSSVRNFRVLKCNPNGWCDVFFVNSSPEGGYKDELKKTRIEELLGVGCAIDGEPVAIEKQGVGINAETEPGTPAETSAAKGTPAGTTADCPFDEPAGTISKTAEASEALFKRVIFEQYRDRSNGRKVGVVYRTFRLGGSYVNRLTRSGLMHDGAPQGAMIHRVKTSFTFCDRYTDSTIRWGYGAQYSCFEDKFGDWVCPSDATKITEQMYLPNE